MKTTKDVIRGGRMSERGIILKKKGGGKRGKDERENEREKPTAPEQKDRRRGRGEVG